MLSSIIEEDIENERDVNVEREKDWQFDKIF